MGMKSRFQRSTRSPGGGQPFERNILGMVLRLCAVAAMSVLATAAPAQFSFGGGNQSMAFPVDVKASVSPAVAFRGETVRVSVAVDIEEGNYVYAMNTDVSGPVPSAPRLESPFLVADEASPWREPEPRIKFDPGFEVEVGTHSGKVTFWREFTVAPNAPEAEIALDGSITLQICTDTSCLPPRQFGFSTSILVRADPNAPAPTAPPAPASETGTAGDDEPVEAGETERQPATTVPPALDPGPVGAATDGGREDSGVIDRLLTGDSRALTDVGLAGFLTAAFLFGLISLLTPCVFPMIPITVSFFTKRAAKTTAERIKLSSIYAGSIVVGFALLGFGLALVMRLLGFGAERAGFINQIASNPWLNMGLAALFIAFALSLFGMFEIAVPSSVTSKLQKAQGGRGDTLGAMLMAVVFVLVSFTCTAPIVGPLIVLTMTSETWLMPLFGLTAYAVGFSLPFFFLGLVPQALSAMPKSGGWLNATKVTMGLLELAAAFKFISNADLVWGWDVFTREVVLAIWIAIALMTAIYLLGAFRLTHDSEVKTIGPVRMMIAASFASLALYMSYGLFGGRLQADLEAFLPPAKSGSLVYARNAPSGGGGGAVPIKDQFITNDLERAIAVATEQNRPLFIDFTGHTCSNCRLMENTVFPLPEVRERLDQMVLVALYTDDREVGDRYLRFQSENFGTITLPYYAIVDPVTAEKFATFGGMTRNPSEYVAFLDRGLSAAQGVLATPPGERAAALEGGLALAQ